MNIRLRLISAIAIAGGFAPLVVSAQQYTITAFPGIAGTYTEASGLNAKGQVVGTMRSVTTSWSRAFVTDPSTNALTEAGTIGGNDAVGVAINDLGQIAGVSIHSPTLTYTAFVTDSSTQTLTSLASVLGPFSWARGINLSGQTTGFGQLAVSSVRAYLSNAQASAITDLGALGGKESDGYGINSRGQVTGYLVNSLGYQHAFVTNASTNAMTDLGTLGGATSWAYAINESGQVTGRAETAVAGQNHAFITDPVTNAMTDIGALSGYKWSSGFAINSKGVVVGEADVSPVGNSTPSMIGFMYANGVMVDLNSLVSASDQANYQIYQAKGINDNGQIAANAISASTRRPIAVLLSPANVAPTVQPTYAGTAGTNGWYRSAVTLSWTVTGAPAPTTTGCGTSAVTADTKGRIFTCTATNSVGTASQSVTVKVDKVAPQAAITAPQSSNEKTYNRNQAVFAKYTCSDLISGVASCVGSVANGARVSTATPGAYSFVVTAIDRAGNTATKTVNYRVR